jgi:hypothetical protein
VENEHLPLATAAAVVYHQVVGATPEVESGDELNDILDRVARALSNVAPIYAVDPLSGKLSPLAPFDLIESSFTRGATLLIGRGGTQYRELSIQREDMRSAIAILKAAKISFPRTAQP